MKGNVLELSDLPNLQDLTGLPAGITAKNITLVDNDRLSDISLFSTYVSDVKGCSLEITRNKVLTSLTGLEGLTTISNLIIKSNARLTSVAAISSVEILGPTVEITDNGIEILFPNIYLGRLCEFNGVNTTASLVAGSNVEDSCGRGTGSLDDSSALKLGSVFVGLIALFI
jgi:hypothetical protein